MLGAEEFGPDFQRVLVRTSLVDGGLRALLRQYTDDGKLGFTDPASAWAWQVVTAQDRPTRLVLETEIRRLSAGDPAYTGAQAILTGTDVRDSDYVRHKVVDWARKQTFRQMMSEIVGHWNKGNEDQAMRLHEERINELQRIQLSDVDRGWFFEEFDERQDRRAFVDQGLDYFALGIEPIDDRMYGGVSYGELEIPFGYSGVGKSFYCVHRGFVAVRSKRNVLHFVLEGGRTKIEDRYEARFTDTLYRAVRRGAIPPDAVAAMRREYEMSRKGLVLRGYADKTDTWDVTIQDILAELSDLRENHGWVPDLIIVDYGDLVKAPGDSEREVQKNAFRQLKRLAEQQTFRGHRGYAICAPAQAIRPDKGAEEREHVLVPRDVADCYEKSRIADAVISINRTLWEQENQQARLFLGKYRDNEDGLLVRILTDYTKGGLAVLGVPEPPPLPPRPP